MALLSVEGDVESAALVGFEKQALAVVVVVQGAHGELVGACGQGANAGECRRSSEPPRVPT